MLVNGKTLKQIFQELREFKGNVEKKNGGKRDFDYIPIESFFSAFDEVIGTENYSVEYSELTYVKVSSGQDMVTCKCSITLLGDDGLPVLRKEGYGASEFVYAKETGKDSGLNNEPHIATTSAFKSAAKWFGVFGTYLEDAPAAKASSSDTKAKAEKPADDKSGDKSKDKKPEINISVHTKDSFFSGGKDKRTDKDVWKIKATLDSDKSECEVVFYPNQYGKNEKYFAALKEMSSQKSVGLRIVVNDCGERNGFRQFIFKDYLAA